MLYNDLVDRTCTTDSNNQEVCGAPALCSRLAQGWGGAGLLSARPIQPWERAPLPNS